MHAGRVLLEETERRTPHGRLGHQEGGQGRQGDTAAGAQGLEHHGEKVTEGRAGGQRLPPPGYGIGAGNGRMGDGRLPTVTSSGLMKWIPFAIDPEQLKTVALLAVPRVVAALLVLLLFWLVLRITQPALRAALHRAHFVDALIDLMVDRLYRATLLTLGLVMAASQFGVNISAALAGIGVAGIAVGFAAQETVANMIAGFLIFWDRPFGIGDFITTQDRYGEVREITLRTTRIRTNENTYIVIPNRQIIGDTLVNHSMYGEMRVNVPLGIAYKERVAEARQVLLEAVAKVEGVMPIPAPDVVAAALGDSSVNLLVRVWIDQAAWERPVFYRVMEASKAALDEAGIEIPFPHLQLFVEDVRERVWSRAAGLMGRTGA
jgi:small conductance mechanosensitive channel